MGNLALMLMAGSLSGCGPNVNRLRKKLSVAPRQGLVAQIA
jgi:hypothetical protein